MKKINISAFVLGVIITASLVSSCGGKRDTGRVYMPDMGGAQTGGYSIAHDAYALLDTTRFTTVGDKRGGNMIFFNSMPVAGTLKRGELYPYTLTNDSIGYKMSASIKSPLTDSLDATGLAEAGRLFNINCAICHGDKAAGNGPLSTSGKVGGVANLSSGEKSMLSDGTMFHVMTYGKGVMGSYASQLSRKQRWQIVKYIRTLQNPKAAAAMDSTAAKGKDSTTVAKK